jgi:hypothetical protein
MSENNKTVLVSKDLFHALIKDVVDAGAMSEDTLMACVRYMTYEQIKEASDGEPWKFIAGEKKHIWKYLQDFIAGGVGEEGIGHLDAQLDEEMVEFVVANDPRTFFEYLTNKVDADKLKRLIKLHPSDALLANHELLTEEQLMEIITNGNGSDFKAVFTHAGKDRVTESMYRKALEITPDLLRNDWISYAVPAQLLIETIESYVPTGPTDKAAYWYNIPSQVRRTIKDDRPELLEKIYGAPHLGVRHTTTVTWNQPPSSKKAWICAAIGTAIGIIGVVFGVLWK